MLSSIPLTVLLSFYFNLFCIHPYPSFISIASHFFLFRLALHFAAPLYTHLPLHACVFVCECVFVCVAAGSSWLFFRQQPRRLDCHNLWSWVISVSNPNWGTGPFFSFLLFTTNTISSSLFFFPSLPSVLSSPIISHSSSHSLVTMHCHLFSALVAIQTLAIDHHQPHVISHALNLEFTISDVSQFEWTVSSCCRDWTEIQFLVFDCNMLMFVIIYYTFIYFIILSYLLKIHPSIRAAIHQPLSSP